MTQTLPSLPLGITDFSELRRIGGVYVDKTDMVCRLAQIRGAQFFLARPRGFGVTTFLSTFEALFTRGTAEFRGLMAERLWTEKRPCPVVRLDFRDLPPTPDGREFQNNFRKYLEKAFNEAHPARDSLGLFPDDSNPANSFVLLIDNLDAPLKLAFGMPDLEQIVRAELQHFCSFLQRDLSGILRFLFITAESRSLVREVLEPFKLLHDLTDDPLPLTGFTTDELRRSFGGWIERIAYEQGREREDLLVWLRESYGGWTFAPLADDAVESRLFPPAAVLSYFERPDNEILPLWSEEEERPDIVAELVRASIKRLGTGLGNGSCAIPSPGRGHESRFTFPGEVTPMSRLLEMGYLTLGETHGGEVWLRYPNREVRRAVSRHISDQILWGATLEGCGIESVNDVFMEDDEEAVEQLFTELLHLIASHDCPLFTPEAAASFIVPLLECSDIPENARIDVSDTNRSEIEIVCDNYEVSVGFGKIDPEEELPYDLEVGVEWVSVCVTPDDETPPGTA